MRIKNSIEIGHTAQQKAKASPEGFTHDWELFVRGADGNNLSSFVDKIVFNLHESFPKPCRSKCCALLNESFCRWLISCGYDAEVLAKIILVTTFAATTTQLNTANCGYHV